MFIDLSCCIKRLYLEKFQSDNEMYIETHSFEEVAQDEQLRDEIQRPNAKSNNLLRNIEEYQLIIIDEAHNYRNPDSPTRSSIRSLLWKKKRFAFTYRYSSK